jgi:segregation and condensation protein A
VKKRPARRAGAPPAEYERFKQAAEDLESLPRADRDFAVLEAWVENRKIVHIPPEIALQDMLSALRDVLGRAELFSHHHVQTETLSVRERMSRVIDRLRDKPYLEFQSLFTVEEGRMGVVVTFLALMELLRERLIDLIQNKPMGQIYVKRPGAAEPDIE